MNESKASQGAVVALGATVIIWASSWIVMKQVLAYAGPFDFSAQWSLAVPVISLLMAWIFLGERPLPNEWLGAAFIVTGLIAVSGVGGARQSRAA